VTWGKWWWPIFLIVTSLAFLVPELIALVTNFRNTLSDYARYELNVTTPTQGFTTHTAAWLLSLGVWLVVAFWLTWHVWWAKF
jgi:hypothetical protein